jgi:hypothetical protein
MSFRSPTTILGLPSGGSSSPSVSRRDAEAAENGKRTLREAQARREGSWTQSV